MKNTTEVLQPTEELTTEQQGLIDQLTEAQKKVDYCRDKLERIGEKDDLLERWEHAKSVLDDIIARCQDLEISGETITETRKAAQISTKAELLRQRQFKARLQEIAKEYGSEQDESRRRDLLVDMNYTAQNCLDFGVSEEDVEAIKSFYTA